MLIATDHQALKPILSNTSKMKGTAKSWSLQAVETCPGSRDKSGALVGVCANCFADKGFYNMPTVKKPRAHNKLAWQSDNYVSDMVEGIGKAKHFRWFDSGDCYHIGLANKILEIMRLTPNCQHWLPTRMHKFTKFRAVFAKMQKLPNVVVRFSSDSVTGETIKGATTSTVLQHGQRLPQGIHACPATTHGNKPNCKANGCTACWDKSVAVIGYYEH
jgi:hypothetical protein